MKNVQQNTIVIAGPTASGKTTLGVKLADLMGGEIVSADSRQVYRGLDIGSGKDLSEYNVHGKSIPYHLIDIVDLSQEFSVFHFQQFFYDAFKSVIQRGHIPIIVGGTGLYLDAALSGYQLVPVPENPVLRAELALMDDEALLKRLCTIRPKQHNNSDMTERIRMIRAIEIAEYSETYPPLPGPDIRPLILVILHPPAILRERITIRLQERMDNGLIEEVEGLHQQEITWERLELLGLEYRFVAQYLQENIKSRNDLFQKLNSAIAQFAKRQRTWFRGMERRGHKIHWLSEANMSCALNIIREHNLPL